MFAREVEDKDSGKHLSVNHLWMEWSDHSTSHRFGPNYDHDSSIRTSSRAGRCESGKTFFVFPRRILCAVFGTGLPGCESAQSILRPALNRPGAPASCS